MFELQLGENIEALLEGTVWPGWDSKHFMLHVVVETAIRTLETGEMNVAMQCCSCSLWSTVVFCFGMWQCNDAGLRAVICCHSLKSCHCFWLQPSLLGRLGCLFVEMLHLPHCTATVAVASHCSVRCQCPLHVTMQCCRPDLLPLQIMKLSIGVS